SLRLLQLPDSIQADLRNGLVSSGHARAILSISDPAAQEELALLIKRNGLNVRQTEALASSWKKGGTFGSRRKTQQPKPASFFHSIKSHLSKRLSCRVQMSGTKDKGAITLKYRNAEEFEKLLEQLGLPDEVSGERK
ncbi:MAG: ParB/RepB/Spo0J family partition protein, partial [Desulfovibrionales bacterium]